MTAKHTPGPWTVVDDVDRFEVYARRSIAVTTDNREDDRANARLIAAAPALYDALRNADALTLAALNAYDPPSALIAAAALVEARGVILSALALANGEV